MNMLRTIKAVGWSFIGIRKNSESQEDMGQLKPFQIIGVALAGVAIFVVALISFVHWVVQ